MVEKKAKKERLGNIRLIRSDSATELPPQSIDVVMLYHTLHDVADKHAVLRELHRVLKPVGRISYKDNTLRGAQALSLMGSNGFFPVEQDFRASLVQEILILAAWRHASARDAEAKPVAY
jgi:ubiquinone/menaquinone biosynthesis C-methylase UbiE